MLQRAVEDEWNLKGVEIVHKNHHITVLNTEGSLHSCSCSPPFETLCFTLAPYYNNSTVYWHCRSWLLKFPGLPSVLWELISEYYFVPDRYITGYTKRKERLKRNLSCTMKDLPTKSRRLMSQRSKRS